ncbi:MAG: DegQ family serine endoprotease [Gammaproteobacteria bacterium]|nr:DegQ family serine endoprotease [Gammaproteobacteria bacterium]
MKRSTSLLFLSLSLVAAMSARAGIPVTGVTDVDTHGTPTLAPMLDRVTPSVVNISTEGVEMVDTPLNPLMNDPRFRRFFDVPMTQRERKTHTLGSGVVVDAAKGYVMTNNHVIQKAKKIRVNLRDGRTLEAKLLGADPATDVAIIQVKPDQLTQAKLGDSDDLRVGDFVVAIGNPFGLGQTVTSGIVSALGRRTSGMQGFEDYIQTDASINPGNSGGALVNLRGELVGINSALYSPNGPGNVGIGFAIPINMARDIMAQLVEYGVVKRGRLGVSTQDMTPALAEAFGMAQIQGAVISRVVPGSAADEVGLKAGDVIVSINGREVNNTSDLRNLIGLLRAGQKVQVQVVRDGKRMTKTAVVAPTQEVSFDGSKIGPFLVGATLAVVEAQDDIGQSQGIRLSKVEPNSAAWFAGFRDEDVILEVNRVSVESARELGEAVALGSSRGQFFKIRRDDETLILLIKKQK